MGGFLGKIIGGGVTDAGAVAAEIIKCFKEDPTVKAQLSQQMELAELQGKIQLMVEQIRVNAVEAANKSVFVAGWRPWVGWICGTALGIPVLTYMVQCLIMLAHGRYDLPPANTSELVTILLGILGLGGLRTYEKVQGSDSPGSVGH